MSKKKTHNKSSPDEARIRNIIRQELKKGSALPNKTMRMDTSYAKIGRKYTKEMAKQGCSPNMSAILGGMLDPEKYASPIYGQPMTTSGFQEVAHTTMPNAGVVVSYKQVHQVTIGTAGVGFIVFTASGSLWDDQESLYTTTASYSLSTIDLTAAGVNSEIACTKLPFSRSPSTFPFTRMAAITGQSVALIANEAATTSRKGVIRSWTSYGYNNLAGVPDPTQIEPFTGAVAMDGAMLSPDSQGIWVANPYCSLVDISTNNVSQSASALKNADYVPGGFIYIVFQGFEPGTIIDFEVSGCGVIAGNQIPAESLLLCDTPAFLCASRCLSAVGGRRKQVHTSTRSGALKDAQNHAKKTEAGGLLSSFAPLLLSKAPELFEIAASFL